MYLNFIIRKSERRNKQSVKTYSMDCGVGVSRHQLRSGIWNEGVCSKQPVSPGNRANQVHLELVNTRGRIKPLRLKNLWLGRGGEGGEGRTRYRAEGWSESLLLRMRMHKMRRRKKKRTTINKKDLSLLLLLTTTTCYHRDHRLHDDHEDDDDLS